MGKRRYVMSCLAVGLVLGLNALLARAVTTQGAPSCGAWVSDRKAESDKKTESSLAMFDEFWLVGFLSGLSVGADMDILRGAEAHSLFLWMDKYCSDHPLDGVGDGAMALAHELKAKMSKAGRRAQ